MVIIIICVYEYICAAYVYVFTYASRDLTLASLSFWLRFSGTLVFTGQLVLYTRDSNVL
jgi:hypothetical protein